MLSLIEAIGIEKYMFKFGSIKVAPLLLQNEEHYAALTDAYMDSIPTTISELYFGGSIGSGKNTLDFNIYRSLQYLIVSGNSFPNIRQFILDGMEHLVIISVGRQSFRAGSSKRSDSICRIANCPKLEIIEFGYYSFQDYANLELTKLPSLRSIMFDQYCFHCTNELVLSGIV